MTVKTILLAVAVCCMVARTFAADCSGTAPYIAPLDTTPSCTNLKTYIGDIIGADKTTECTVPAADLDEIKKKDLTTCTGLGAQCTCLTAYYQSDLSDHTQSCVALTTLETCIGVAADGPCATETKADLIKFVTERKAVKSCPAGSGNPVTLVQAATQKPASMPVTQACAPGDCKNGGACGLGNKLPCICTAGFIGPTCETAASFQTTPTDCTTDVTLCDAATQTCETDRARSDRKICVFKGTSSQTTPTDCTTDPYACDAVTETCTMDPAHSHMKICVAKDPYPSNAGSSSGNFAGGIGNPVGGVGNHSENHSGGVGNLTGLGNPGVGNPDGNHPSANGNLPGGVGNSVGSGTGLGNGGKGSNFVGTGTAKNILRKYLRIVDYELFEQN